MRATVEKVDPAPFDTYTHHLRFETEEGETVKKRFQAQVGENVVDLLYDPRNPKRA